MRPQAEELEGKESIVQPSFKQRLDTLKYVAVSEAEKSISKRKDKVKVQGKKATMSTVHIPATYLWIALLLGFISVFIAFCWSTERTQSSKHRTNFYQSTYSHRNKF